MKFVMVYRVITTCALLGVVAPLANGQDVPHRSEVKVQWNHELNVSRSTPTLQVVVNPQVERGATLHDPSFAALKALGADYVRYVPWLPYPKQAVAELEPPKNGKTSWDFTYIDPTLDDFMKATEGHSVILNFSTMPAWLWKTPKPVTYPADPQQVYWHYTQGTELRDPSMKEAADYYARLISWYTKGGLTDENGKWHESGHHYKIAYWEVLNEPDLEHHWTPENYTKFYDAVTAAMHKVDPDLKFVGLALAHNLDEEHMFEYFLNPANHAPGTPLDFISYHFYAEPTAEENLDNWQYTFFNQADGFIKSVRLIEEIRKRYSPSTKTDLDELGVILPVDGKDNRVAGYKAPEPPADYWNLAGAMYAYLYAEFAKDGIDVVGESQLVGYHTQFPSVSMMDYITNKPNARFWVLKLLKDNFGPGDTLVATSATNLDADGGNNRALKVQAFDTAKGKRLLLINQRTFPQTITLPAEFANGRVSLVAPSTGDQPPATATVAGRTLHLESNEVAVVSVK